MKLAAILSTLSVSASIVQAAPAKHEHKRDLATQKGLAQPAIWDAIAKQAGPDLKILCQGVLPLVTDTATFSTTTSPGFLTTYFATKTESVTSTVMHTAVIEEIEPTTIVETIESTLTSFAEPTTTTVTDITVTIPTSTVTITTLGQPSRKRALTDDTRALFAKLYQANATFVLGKCALLFEPVHVTVTSTSLTTIPTEIRVDEEVTKIESFSVDVTTLTTTTSTSTAYSKSTLVIPTTITSTVTASATATVNTIATVIVCQPATCPPSFGTPGGDNYGDLKQNSYPNCLYTKATGRQGSFNCEYDYATGNLKSTKIEDCPVKAIMLTC